MTDAEMAVRATSKVERELNAESRYTTESRDDITITLTMRPNAVITELADGWLEIP
jgi:PHD/YefM family antitoxin component YafN of YafNO toxin-antitoxin module